MPAVVIPIAAAAAGAGVAGIVGAGIGAAIVSAVVSIAVTTVLDRLLVGKPAQPDVAQDMSGRTLTVNAPDETRKIVYGETRVGGSFVFFDPKAGNTDMVWYVIALADHRIDSYQTIFLDDEPIDVATQIDGTGLVTAPAFVTADGDKLVKTALPTGTQTAANSRLLTDLAPLWTDAHIGRGLAYMGMRIQVDRSDKSVEDPDASVWHNGYPSSYSATIRGKRVYDPRDETQDIDNPSTWRWSNNPALCLADYLTDADLGFGESTDRIDYTAVAAAANVCEETTNVWNALGTGSVAQQRYTCDGVIDTALTHDEIIQQLLSSMAGRLIFVQGKYEIQAGGWSLPVLALSDADCVGEQEYRERQGMREVFNSVVGTYVHQLRGYERVDFVPQSDAAYVTEDGFSEDRSIDLPMTQDEYRAQWLARLALRQGRNQATYGGGFTLKAAQVTPGDVITFSSERFGWIDKTWRVVEWEQRRTDAGAEYIWLAMIEDDEDAYDMLDHTALTKYVAAPSLESVPAVPVPPSNLAADGDSRGITLTWSNPGDLRDVVGVQVFRSDTSGSGYLVVTTTLGEQFIDPVLAGLTKFYKIRTLGVSGKASEYVGPVSAESFLAYDDATNNGHANLVTDPDFTRTTPGDTDERFWLFDGDAEVLPNGGIDGKPCLRLRHSGGQASARSVAAFNIHKDQQITVTVAVRLDASGDSATSLEIRLFEQDASGVLTFLQVEVIDVPSTTYTHVSATFTVSEANTVAGHIDLAERTLSGVHALRVNDAIAYYGGELSGLTIDDIEALVGSSGNLDGGGPDAVYGGGDLVDGGEVV